MRARIDITEVEARTKIRAKYLRAIENEEWNLLPGPVYVKSFLRTYGDFLGLDSRLLIDDYKRRYERPSDQELRPVATLHRERERAARGPLVPPWAIIGAVLVVVVVALYLIGIQGNKTKVASPAGVHATPLGGHRQRTRRGTPASGGVRPRTVRLALRPTGPVYVCLVDGRGRRLIPGRIFAAGQTILPQRATMLLLTLGNASVLMSVNGKDIHVPPSSGSIGYRLTPAGAAPLPLSRQPRCA